MSEEAFGDAFEEFFKNRYTSQNHGYKLVFPDPIEIGEDGTKYFEDCYAVVEFETHICTFLGFVDKFNIRVAFMSRKWK